MRTAERWAIDRVQSDDVSELRKIRLGIHEAMLAAGQVTEDRLKSIQDLWDDIYRGIMRTTEDTKQETADSRYEEVFGKVTDADVEELTQHLEDRTLANDQESMSKEAAMKLLEHELSQRFRNRIG